MNRIRITRLVLAISIAPFLGVWLSIGAPIQNGVNASQVVLAIGASIAYPLTFILGVPLHLFLWKYRIAYLWVYLLLGSASAVVLYKIAFGIPGLVVAGLFWLIAVSGDKGYIKENKLSLNQIALTVIAFSFPFLMLQLEFLPLRKDIIEGVVVPSKFDDSLMIQTGANYYYAISSPELVSDMIGKQVTLVKNKNIFGKELSLEFGGYTDAEK